MAVIGPLLFFSFTAGLIATITLGQYLRTRDRGWLLPHGMSLIGVFICTAALDGIMTAILLVIMVEILLFIAPHNG